MKSKRACGEKMRVESYRFIVIGSIVSAFLLYFISVKAIVFISTLLTLLWTAWNYRNELGIKRRLLQSGLSLGLAHKSNRVSRRTSNLNSISKAQVENHKNPNAFGQETFNNTLNSPKKETLKSSGYDFSNSLVSNVGFTSPQAFVFGSPKIGKSYVSQRQAKGALHPAAAASSRSLLQHRRLLSPEDSPLMDEHSQEQGTPGYIFQPRRVLSVARQYPTHQPRYGQVGLFPSVHLSPYPVPVLNKRSDMGNYTPVTVRIGPPKVFTPSPMCYSQTATSRMMVKDCCAPKGSNDSSKLSFNASPSTRASEKPDPCDARTVVAALRENSRKRIRHDETADFDSKRQRCDSSSNSSTSLSISNVFEQDKLLPMEEGDHLEAGQTAANKRPATPGPLHGPLPGLLQKRHKNNAILSSYSSTAKQKSDSCLPRPKQVKVSSPVTDKFSQTDSSWLISEPCTPEPNVPSKASVTSQDTSANDQEPEKRDQMAAMNKSPFPALKEGHSPRQNIDFYANIGKSYKFVYNMPGYLPTLKDHQQDKEIEQQRLNHLLYGSKRTPEVKTSVPEPTSSTSFLLPNKAISVASDQTTTSSLTAVSSSKVATSPPTSDSNTQLKPPPFSLSVPSSTPSLPTIAMPYPNSEESKKKENDSLDSENSTEMKTSTAESMSKPALPGAGFFSTNFSSPVTTSTQSSMTPTQVSTPSSGTAAGVLSPVKPTESSSDNPLLSFKSPAVTSEGFLSSFTKPESPLASNTLNKSVSMPTTSTSFTESFFKPPPPSVSQEKSPITTLTTATTTQTSIPSFNLFTSQSNTKESSSVTLSNQVALPTTTLTSSVVTSSVPSVFSMTTTTPAGPPPPYPATSTISQPNFLASSSPFGTTKTATSENQGFQFNAESSPFRNQSLKADSATPARNIFLQSGGLFGSTGTPTSLAGAAASQPTFGIPASTSSSATELPSTPNPIFRLSSDAGSTFSTASQKNSPFLPTTHSGISIPSSTSGQSAGGFGSLTQAGTTFGSNSSQLFSISSPSATTFGMPKSNIFAPTSMSTTTTTTASIATPTLTTNAFGSTTQPVASPFSTSSANTSFGQFPSSSNSFGIASQGTNSFGQVSNTFGVGSQQNVFGQQQPPTFGSTMFGSNNNNQPFGSLSTAQQSSFGSRVSEEPFGATNTSSNIFTPVADLRTILNKTKNDSISSPCLSPFGNGNNLTSPAPAPSQTNAFDGSKALGQNNPAPSVFGSSLPTSNPTTPASINFNFNPKPTFNFGATGSTPNFGSGTPSQQPFVFTGGGGVSNTLAPSPNTYFSIGAGNRDRTKQQPRKRYPRK